MKYRQYFDLQYPLKEEEDEEEEDIDYNDIVIAG
jgi:hypothetical protein